MRKNIIYNIADWNGTSENDDKLVADRDVITTLGAPACLKVV